MGWASGSEIYDSLMDIIKKTVPDYAKRKEFHLLAIDVFEDYDCDTLYELIDDDADPAFVEAFKEIHADDDLYEDDDES